MTPARLVASAISASGGCGLGGVSLTQLSVPREWGGAAKVPEEYRSRRSCLAGPGSSQRFLDKARRLGADEVSPDLEAAAAGAAKATPRRHRRAAPTTGGWGGKLV